MDVINTMLQDPPLDAESERRLVMASRAGDERATDRVVRAGLRLVALRVRALRVPPARVDDAFQAGAVAMLSAVERFDPDRGVRFATYAWPWITHAVDRVRAGEPSELPSAILPERSSSGGPAQFGGDRDHVERDEAVSHALDTLSETERRAVVVRFGMDREDGSPRSWAEVSDVLAVSPSAARRRVERAMSRMRTAIGRVSDRAPERSGADPP